MKVLMDSLTHQFGVEPRKRFPTFYAYIEMEGDDIDNPTVKKLKEDYTKIKELYGSLELGIIQGSSFVNVSSFKGEGHFSPHAPFMAQIIVRPTVNYNAKDRLESMINQSLLICDEAIRRDCGFGKYTK